MRYEAISLLTGSNLTYLTLLRTIRSRGALSLYDVSIHRNGQEVSSHAKRRRSGARALCYARGADLTACAR
jgi:hypothetical protein